MNFCKISTDFSTISHHWFDWMCRDAYTNTLLLSCSRCLDVAFAVLQGHFWPHRRRDLQSIEIAAIASWSVRKVIPWNPFVTCISRRALWTAWWNHEANSTWTSTCTFCSWWNRQRFWFPCNWYRQRECLQDWDKLAYSIWKGLDWN